MHSNPYQKVVTRVEKLRTPFQVNAVYLLLLGLLTLSPSIASSVFSYEVKDPGILHVLSATFLGYGVVSWGIASSTEKYGGLATSLAVSLAIATVFNIWGWATGLFTARTVLVPTIINIVLVAWIWSARPKS